MQNVYLVWQLWNNNKQPYLVGLLSDRADIHSNKWKEEFKYRLRYSRIGFQLVELGDYYAEDGNVYTDDTIYIEKNTEWLN